MKTTHVQNERLFWVDFVRASAALMVVLLHAGSPYLVRIGRVSDEQWLVIHSVEAFIQVCVPLFFMLSGYLYLSKENLRLRRMIARSIIPLSVYSAFAALYLYHFRDVAILDTIIATFNGKAFYHLWFFYTLTGVYFVLYFIRPRQAPNFKLIIVVVALMVFMGGGTARILREYGISSRFFVDGMFFGFVLYSILGFYLGRVDLLTSLSRRRRILIFTAGYLIFSAVTLYLSQTAALRVRAETAHEWRAMRLTRIMTAAA